ncbi:MAG TPA: holo-[acyl-carrier-protein] synthase [Anaerolineae bacterium]|nr:holo-[acyl-carrier-protein] synthase [Anaerolineae bacterium]
MLRVGVDVIEIARFQQALERHGEAFLVRIFTPAEIAAYAHRIPSLAARWAAKEAVAKALGTGIGEIGWKEIEVLADDRHAPVLYLHGRAQELAQTLGLNHWAISLSHTQTLAIAFVTAMAGETRMEGHG